MAPESLKVTLRSWLKRETVCVCVCVCACVCVCVFALTKALLYVYQPAVSCGESMWSPKGRRAVIS